MLILRLGESINSHSENSPKPTRGVEHRKALEVTGNDWLLEQPRAAAATERILQAAASLIGRRGFDDFSIHELAASVHCSPATIYRHAGGKAAICEAVVVRLSSRIVNAVDDAICDLTGHERIVVAVSVALHHLRTEHIVQQLLRSSNPKNRRWIETSPIVTGIATSMIGSDRHDEAAAQCSYAQCLRCGTGRQAFLAQNVRSLSGSSGQL